MTGPGAEMPFLEHLEELRGRLLRVVLALLAGGVIGFVVVQQFQVVELLKAPIAPYLQVTAGKLVVTSPTEAVMITLKLAVVLGMILVSPYVVYQIWAFLSPALYERERRTVVPALVAGLAFFAAGGAFAWLVVLPQSLPILFSFQSQGLENLITFQEYFSFVTQLVLAMGLCFEIPLVLMLLTALGVLTPAGLTRFRRFAIVLAAVGGAVLSPGTDMVSMVMFMVPILLLYEIGYLGSWVIHRRGLSRAAALLMVLGLLAGRPAGVAAQEPATPRRPPKPIPSAPGAPAPPARPAAVGLDSVGADTLSPRPGQPLDTMTARRLGLPTAPRRPFPAEDSVMTRLLERSGYLVTRFRSDSATLFAEERRFVLRGQASTRRGPTTLEADSIAYQEADCMIRAVGDPALFDRETILTGFGGIRYNTCLRRGVVTDALTSFQQGSTDWFLRGNLAQDSSAARLYASQGEITSCDLPEPHYHFSAREVKWVSKSVMVARPAVLYVRDVPVLWLPFIFQDTRPGRRSGILIPRFGLNDIVRQDPGYNRQVTNVGYYWAPSDYFDVVAKLDWYANRYVDYGAAGQYRVLDRFLSGTVGYQRTVEQGGRRATTLRWDHRQNFDLSTSLYLNLNYTSSTTVRRRNAIDPLLSTQQISSAANFSKRFAWGTVSLGGNRRQNLSDGSVTLQFPSLAITPKPIDLSGSVTWSPGLSITNSLESNVPLRLAQVLPGGGLDTARRDSRTSTVAFETPLRLGGFNWRNSLGLSDHQVDGLTVIGGMKVPDPTTPDPTDSITVSQVAIGDFASEVTWETGINLPTLFRSSWKVQPGLQIVNATSGPFLIRNRNTAGRWVRQGKRLNYGASASPTFFGFFPGVGPLARIRHSVSPVITWSYSPSAAVDPDFARAIAAPGAEIRLRSDPVQLLSLGLSQNIEGKRRAPDGDTTGVAVSRKLRLLGIQTSALQYDVEQAKRPGRNGWRTQTLTNQFQSDLLAGFNLSLTHDLWRGPVGYDSTRFDPFLQSVTASFGVSARTFRSLLGLVGVGGREGKDTTAARPEAEKALSRETRFGRPPSFYGDLAGQTVGAGTGVGKEFHATFDYSLSRKRPTLLDPSPESQQSLRFSTAFSPTPFWTVSWSSQYNITRSRFESHVVRLERILHEWRAGFNFVRNPNGNFALFVSVYLSDLPDIKFDYNQTSIER